MEFSLSEVLRESIELLTPECREKGLVLESDFDLGRNDWVCGHPGRIGQVLQNLLGNAIKFTHEGRVSLLVRRILEKFGASVRVVQDGGQAVGACAEERWDAILMDQHMPEFDGVDAAMQIRHGSGPNRTTPLLAVTASVLEEDRLRCARAGMCRFLTKPLSARELCVVLREVVAETASVSPDPSLSSNAA